ncbi:hypothetical protein DL98DRAFT_77138 [Cadophora sp. DSE1049]|nr:hypothetical protein DL98DRAFT_77138 [Cadophora sp. DSE1049]
MDSGFRDDIVILNLALPVSGSEATLDFAFPPYVFIHCLLPCLYTCGRVCYSFNAHQYFLPYFTILVIVLPVYISGQHSTARVRRERAQQQQQQQTQTRPSTSHVAQSRGLEGSYWSYQIHILQAGVLGGQGLLSLAPCSFRAPVHSSLSHAPPLRTERSLLLAHFAQPFVHTSPFQSIDSSLPSILFSSTSPSFPTLWAALCHFPSSPLIAPDIVGDDHIRPFQSFLYSPQAIGCRT